MKTFDCIYHSLHAKLHVYGVSHIPLELILLYSENRTQQIQIESSDSRFIQGSILGPLCFKINLIDLFYEWQDSDIENYADDTTPYTCTPDIDRVISKLYSISNMLFMCFKNAVLVMFENTS